MPLPVDGLTQSSSRNQVQEAITASIQQCVAEGGSQEECAARVNATAKSKVSGPMSRIQSGLTPPT